ncbi:MAG: cytochrome c [Caulobacteraceae bacterium]
MRAAILALSTLLCAAPAAAADLSAPGRGLFLDKCGKCHLEGGTGTFMLGRRLGKDKALLEDRTDLNPAYVRRVVRHGVNSMPWLTPVELPDADLAAIASYLARTRQQ